MTEDKVKEKVEDVERNQLLEQIQRERYFLNKYYGGDHEIPKPVLRELVRVKEIQGKIGSSQLDEVSVALVIWQMESKMPANKKTEKS